MPGSKLGGGVEEEVVVCVDVRTDQVARCVLRQVTLALLRLTLRPGLLEIRPRKKRRHEARIHRKPSQDNRIRQIRIHGRQGIRLPGAERVSNMDDFLGLLADARERALAHHPGHFRQRGDFQRRLDFALGVSVRGLTAA